jgi:zinc resistance-associated protein
MNGKLAKRTLIISAVILLSGAALAFAHGGYGRGYDGDGHGYGGHMRGWGGGHMMGYGQGPMMRGDGYGPHMRGYGYGNALSREDADKLDAAREKFFDETKALREQIEEKRIDLGQEMRKEEPDAAKAATLQKELSKLETEFDQKALAHRLEMRRLLPENFEGRGYGRGPGYGGRCW